jgi:8-oxo-dGTP pyrophosphatase MutT (NUDIX family)
MDSRCLSLTLTPKVLQLDLSFKNEDDTLNSIRAVESAYWDYIDNYNKESPRRYPYLKLVQFFEQIMWKRFPDLVDHVPDMIKRYTKYKKSLATDGVIMYTMDGGLKLLLVRINGSRIWSMPKGKRESGEESLACAVREFREETGIDISDTATRDMDSVAILKTNFYVLESDYQISLKGYRTNEISGVRWVDCKEIQANRDCYSKQVIFALNYLKEII